MNPHYVIVRAGDVDASSLEEGQCDVSSQALREGYFALRTRAFEAHWGAGLYPPGPDAYDLLPDTRYALLVEDGKVIAGTRIVFHAPGSEQLLPMEEHHPDLALSRLLPGISARDCAYAEVGGLVSDPDIAYRRLRLGTAVLGFALTSLATREVQHGKPVDLVMCCASKLGMEPLVQAARTAQLPGIVREDLIRPEEDARFDTQLIPVVLGISTDVLERGVQGAETRALASNHAGRQPKR